MESKDNLILLITTYSQSYDNSKCNHYSNIKGKLLGDGLKELNYTPCYLTNENYEIYDSKDEFYINHKVLKPEFLTKFKFIVFCLHNAEILKQFYEETDIFNNIIKAKELNPKLLVINKTCLYPTALDYTYNIDSLQFFDKILLQTENVKIPKYIVRKILDYNRELPIKTLHKINTEFIQKFNSSEMTFYTQHKHNPYNLNLDPTKTNLVYIGRLTWCNGMDMNYIIKIMKRLGANYKLHIIPGSFKLPNDPNMKKYGCTRVNYMNLYKKFFNNYKLDYLENNLFNYLNKENFMEEDDDYDVCNIEVLPQFNYGEHFSILKQFDIGLVFSQNKTQKEDVGSTKIFDYMCSNIKIVSEDGFHNSPYVKKYNYGKLISMNSTIDEYVSAIKQVEKMDKSDIKYDQYIGDHNYVTRAQDFLNKVL